MVVNSEQRREIRLGLIYLIDETDSDDDRTLRRQAAQIASAVAPNITMDELAAVLREVDSVVEPSAMPHPGWER